MPPMVLSDHTIKEEIAKGRIVIEPLDPACIQPASIDIHLDNKLLVFRTWRHPFYIDVRQNIDELSDPVEISEDGPFFLNAGGLLIHSTAGYVDPGWCGHLTLELSNVAKFPVTLYYKMAIGQISFLRLTSPVERLYGSSSLGSKYQGQTEPTATRYYEDFIKEK
jgi:dCTP deaminase